MHLLSKFYSLYFIHLQYANHSYANHICSALSQRFLTCEFVNKITLAQGCEKIYHILKLVIILSQFLLDNSFISQDN